MMKNLTAPMLSFFRIYFLVLIIFCSVIIFPSLSFAQCKMGNLVSSGGAANLSSGSDCIFRLSNTGVFGRRTTVKFNNGTTTGGSP
jgi:hypothetical protein